MFSWRCVLRPFGAVRSFQDARHRGGFADGRETPAAWFMVRVKAGNGCNETGPKVRAKLRAGGFGPTARREEAGFCYIFVGLPHSRAGIA
jgi:hypothetical protein